MTHLAAIAGIVGISFSAIFMRLASPAPATGAFFRAAYALPLLAAAWALVRSRDHRSGKARLWAFGAGALLAVDLALWQMSIDRIGAGLAIVIANVQVVFVGALGWALYKERPTNLAIAAVPVVLLGVVLISGVGLSDAYGSDPAWGTVFGILTAMTYAGFLVTFRHSNRADLAPAAGPLLDATLGTAVGASILGLFDPGFSLAWEWPMHGWLLGLGVLIQTFGWIFITVALPRLPVLQTSMLLLLQPMLAIVWAQLIFSEDLSPLQWVGVAVVLIGVVTVAVRGSVRAEPVTPESAAAPRGS